MRATDTIDTLCGMDPVRRVEADHRKRLRRREDVDRPGVRYLTFSCYQRLPLLVCGNDDAIGRQFAKSLDRARRRLAFGMFAWVVMPEHVHLLIRPAPSQTWALIASSIKNSVAKFGLSHLRRIESTLLGQAMDSRGRARYWQMGGGFDRTIRDDREFSKAVRYIHNNPVERGLVARAEDWRLSSVRWWMGRREDEIECDPPPGGGWERWTGYA